MYFFFIKVSIATTAWIEPKMAVATSMPNAIITVKTARVSLILISPPFLGDEPTALEEPIQLCKHYSTIVK